MRSLRRWLMSLFALSGSQANGILVLLPLLLVLMASEPAWRWWKVRSWGPNAADQVLLDSIATIWRSSRDTILLRNGKKGVSNGSRIEYFAFDPNVATRQELIRLGFNDRLAQRIDNYRKKGGVFKSKEDLLKIYGMDTVQFRRIVKYMQIRRTGEKVGTAKSQAHTFPPYSSERRFQERKVSVPFDLNIADTTRLEEVRGIGPKLSRRIIKYRSSLGGFVRVGQLREVFGLDSTTVLELEKLAFVAPDFLPDRIDINAADEKRLDSHPYLNRQDARAIVAYRFQHGRFEAVSDLRGLPNFDEEKLRQIEPYLVAVK